MSSNVCAHARCSPSLGAHSRLVALVCEGRNSCFVNDRVQQQQQQQQQRWQWQQLEEAARAGRAGQGGPDWGTVIAPAKPLPIRQQCLLNPSAAIATAAEVSIGMLDTFKNSWNPLLFDGMRNEETTHRSLWHFAIHKVQSKLCTSFCFLCFFLIVVFFCFWSCFLSLYLLLTLSRFPCMCVLFFFYRADTQYLAGISCEIFSICICIYIYICLSV